MSEVKRDVCHACVSLPRENHCPVCDPEMGCRKELDAQRLRADMAEAELKDIKDGMAYRGSLFGKVQSERDDYERKLAAAEQRIANHESTLRHFASCADVRQVGTSAMDYVAALNQKSEGESQ